MKSGLVLLLTASLLAQSCGRKERDGGGGTGRGPETPSESASLLLVTLDTFRADAAGCGGDPRGRTPHLDRLARTGVQFETGLVPTPLTLPSHTSMLTGLDPPAHGVRDNGAFRLAPTVPTVAERLRAAGFATAAFIAAFPLDARFGLDRGFDVYDDAVGPRGEEGFLVMDQRDGGLVTAAAREWLASSAARGRRFVFVHLFDAHSPPSAAPAMIAALHGDGYRADAAWADRWLGAAVRAALYTGQFWVVVLGDHGESLGDHQEATHGLFVYGATTRVPAVVWPAPAGEEPGVRRATFRAVDFPATAFALLGLSGEAAPGSGVPVFEREAGPAYLESLYARFHYGWSALRALQDGGWKYIDAPDPELYDLARDPGERRNVVSEHPDRARELAARLAQLAAQPIVASEVELDAQALATLRSLGYVTGVEAADSAHPDVGGADPKDMVAVQGLLERAQNALSAGQPDAAFGPLRAALSRDPDNKDVHQTMGLAHSLAGRHADAVDWFRRCLELPPHWTDRVPRFELASSLLRLGRNEEAGAQLEIVVSEFPGDASAWYNLGIAREALGRSDGAREAWTRALEADPENPLARSALGR